MVVIFSLIPPSFKNFFSEEIPENAENIKYSYSFGIYPDINYVTQLEENEIGQKLVRFYDLDGNLIEVKG